MKKLEETRNQFRKFSDEFMEETKGMQYYEKYWEMLDEVQYQLDKMIIRRNNVKRTQSIRRSKKNNTEN